MGFNDFTSGEVTALQQVAVLQSGGQLVTNATVNAAIVAQNASWAAPFVVTEIQLDATGNANIVRSAKIHHVVVNTFGNAASDTMAAIVETNTWSDGDSVYFWVKTGKTIEVALPAVSVTLRESGDFVKLVRVYGAWQLESVSPAYITEGFGTVQTIQILPSDVAITSDTSIASVRAVSAGTPAAAIYTITAVSGAAGDAIYLDVDGVAIGTGTDGTSIDNMGISLRDAINLGTDFTATYNAGTNELTVTDALNRGTLGNSFLLGSLEVNGAVGSVTTQFTGGLSGSESIANISTINGFTEGKTLTVFNAMTTNALTLLTSGNIILPDDLTLGPRTSVRLTCMDGLNWYGATPASYDGRRDVTAAVATYTAGDTIVYFDTTANVIAYSIDPLLLDGKEVTVKFRVKGGGNNVTITSTAGQIEFAANLVMTTRGDAYKIFGRGNDLFVLP